MSSCFVVLLLLLLWLLLLLLLLLVPNLWDKLSFLLFFFYFPVFFCFCLFVFLITHSVLLLSLTRIVINLESARSHKRILY